MTQWQRTLDLNDVWTKVDNGEMTIQELAKEVSVRLRALASFEDEGIEEGREEVAELFESLSEDDTATVENFDYCMNDLYYWADTKLDSKWNGKKVCWVKTFG